MITKTKKILTLLFKGIFILQPIWEEDTELFHVPPALYTCTPTKYQYPPTMIYLLQLMGLHWHIIITQSPLFTLEFNPGVVYSTIDLDKCIMICMHNYSFL